MPEPSILACLILDCRFHLQESIYDVLLLLADMPGNTHVREAAVSVLGLLPSASTIPQQLRSAFTHANPNEQLQLLLLGSSAHGIRPARLLYVLQVGSYAMQGMPHRRLLI